MPAGLDAACPEALLVLAWPGASLALAEEGRARDLMPCLDALMRRGSAGILRGYAPHEAPMIAGSLATGEDPLRHGLHPLAALRAWGAAAPPAVLAQPFWRSLAARGIACGVVGWPGAGPLDEFGGGVVEESFVAARPESAIHPPELAGRIAPFQIKARDLDPAIMRLMIPRLDEINLARDRRPVVLATLLAELYSLHNAAIALVTLRRLAVLAVYLPFLESVSQAFMAYRTPRRAEITVHDHALYGGVVDAAYRLMDLLLADLLSQLAPHPTVFVVSGHSVASGEDRPKNPPWVSAALAPAWNRGPGLFVAAGPGIAAQLRRPILSSLDFAPTILAAVGLPMPASLTGRPPPGLILRPVALERRAAERTPGATREPADDPAWRERQRLRLVNLGYLALSPTQPPAPNWTQANFSLGLALAELGKAEEALPYLQQSYYEEPEALDLAYHYARVLLGLGLAEAAAEPLAAVDDHCAESPRAGAMRARLALLEHRYEAALELARRAAPSPEFGPEAGEIERTALLLLRRFGEARPLVEAAFGDHPDDPLLHAAMGCLHLRDRDYAAALHSARRAVELAPVLGVANRLLARIQARIGAPQTLTPSLTGPTWEQLGQRSAQRRRLREAVRHWRDAWQQTRGVTPLFFAVRAPFESERPRMLAHWRCPVPHLGDDTCNWVLAAGEAQRLVGRFLLELPPEGRRAGMAARAGFALRGNWAENRAAATLIETAQAESVRRGCGGLSVECGAGSPEEAVLLRAGFAVHSRHEVWVSPTHDLERRARTFGRAVERYPITVAALAESNLPGVRALCSRLGLLTADRVQLAEGVADRMDPRYSFVAGHPDKPDAVILCRLLRWQLYLEVLARDPDSTAQGAVPALVQRMMAAARENGVAEIISTLTQDGRAHPAAALMRRTAGRLLRARQVMVWASP